MHDRKFGVRQPIDLIEPCFDMENKDYIIRDDAQAEQYRINRMKATVARSINPKDLQNDYTSAYKKRQ